MKKNMIVKGKKKKVNEKSTSLEISKNYNEENISKIEKKEGEATKNKEQLSNLELDNKNLKKMLDSANIKYRTVIKNENYLREKILNMEKENEGLNNIINNLKKNYSESLSSIELALIQINKENNEFIEKNKVLQKQYNNILSKYKAISSSKLGKLTLKYWQYKRGAFAKNDK